MESATLKTVDLPVAEIFADPDFNCRGWITPGSVIDLSRSIELNGLQQPLVVRPYDNPPYKWRVVMGHRRHMAFKVLKRELVPCVIRTDLSEHQARVMNLIENLERKDLTVMQEAHAIEKFLIAGITQEEVAKSLGKSKGWVQTRYTALKLPKEIQAEINAGNISQEQIRDLYALPSLEAKYAAVKEIKERKERGERKPLKVKAPKRKKNEKKVRSQNEIFEMQDLIRETVGNNIGTRALAWASGMISDYEMHLDLKKLADEKGVPYAMPKEFAGMTLPPMSFTVGV